jgi:membrane-associated phospholipid phosphatase
MIKGMANRGRPYVYNPDTPADKISTVNATESFLSGHTSFAAANMFFIATVYAQHHPDGKLKPYLWTGAAVVPAVVGVLRVASGNHFTTDVIAGYALGAATGMLIPTIHKIKTQKSKKETVKEQRKL